MILYVYICIYIYTHSYTYIKPSQDPGRFHDWWSFIVNIILAMMMMMCFGDDGDDTQVSLVIGQPSCLELKTPWNLEP